MKPLQSACTGALLLYLALICSITGSVAARVLAQAPTASTNSSKLQPAYVVDLALRFQAEGLVPFTTANQLLIIEALEQTLIQSIGLLEFITFGQYPADQPNNNETVPFVDMIWRGYINYSPAAVATEVVAKDYLDIENYVSQRLGDFYAFVALGAKLGLNLNVRVLRFSHYDGMYNPNGGIQLRPMAVYQAIVHLLGSSAEDFTANGASLVLNVMRDQLVGTLGSDVTLGYYANDLQRLQGDGGVTVAMMVMVTVWPCTGNTTLDATYDPPCVNDPPSAVSNILMGSAMASALSATGMNISVGVDSVTEAPPPDTSTTSTLGLALNPQGNAPYSPNLPAVPWQLDRINQPTLPLDGEFSSDVYGTGVNVYVLSSGVRATHSEFQHVDPAMSGTRVKGLWALQGLDPLQDCVDSSLFYGFGTYAAGLVAGLQYGVAKNATIYSVRLRSQCITEGVATWVSGGMTGALDAVLEHVGANPGTPSVMVIDTYWSPDRFAFDNDTYLEAAISERLVLANKLNITVVAPGGLTENTSPCDNVFAHGPDSIMVSAVDDQGRRTFFTADDNSSAPCIDIWAPGGTLGLPIFAASADADDLFANVLAVSESATYLTAGVVAQYLQLNPKATPAEVHAAIEGMATPNILTDIGTSPNRFLFTDFMLPNASAPAPPVVVVSTKSSSSAPIGLIVGIAVPVALIAVLLVLFLVWRRKRRQAPVLQRKTDLQDWEADPAELRICLNPDGTELELGKGNFGRVVKGIRNEVQEVALKMTLVRGGDMKSQDDFIREIAMMKYVSRDNNIVQFYGGCIYQDALCLIVEYMEGGDLRKAIQKDSSGKLTWHGAGKEIALDIMRGLAFLHSNQVTHRDIKSKNILLNREGHAKIGDVGLAKVMAEGYLTRDNALGTFAWAAPELLLGDRCTEKVDIYSFGVVLWEIVTQEMPIRGALRDPVSPDECPEEVTKVIHACMRKDPTQRPSATEVYKLLEACPNDALSTADLKRRTSDKKKSRRKPSVDDSAKNTNSASSDSNDNSNSNSNSNSGTGAQPLARQYTFGDGTMNNLNQLMENLGARPGEPNKHANVHSNGHANGNGIVIPPSFARHASARSDDLGSLV